MSQHSARTEEYKRARLVVLERDGHTCQLQLPGCSTTATQADHVIPKDQGGTDDPANLVAACGSCNNKKSNKPLVRAQWYNPRWFDVPKQQRRDANTTHAQTVRRQ